MHFKLFFTIVISSALHFSLSGQSFQADLYPKGQIPDYISKAENEHRDSTDIIRISKVQTPALQVFLPSKKSATGEAVIICPGGGYHYLSYDWEGLDVAKYWNSKGIAAMVLKYRLPVSYEQHTSHKIPLMDAQRAIRLVRHHAEEWNINPHKTGIMGFSAGGHLASTLSTHFDQGDPNNPDPVERISCRPDFSILIYPVITFTKDFQHSGSHHALLGKNPDPELSEFYSSELQTSSDTPPAILIHASDDKSVPVENSLSYFQSLVEKDVEVAMHIYPSGGHGFGLAVDKNYLSTWPERCYEWLKNLDL